MQTQAIFLFLSVLISMIFLSACIDGLPASQNVSTVRLAEPDPELSHYYVYFRDKGPGAGEWPDVDPHLAERRKLQGLPSQDQYDRLVHRPYIYAVANMVDSLRIQSRWLNAVSVRANAAQIASVARLDFVERIQPFRSQAVLTQAPVSKAGVDRR
ncbi:MAG: hypothetical protein AAGM67_06600, partial [Bacteroidota bacterium]